MAETLTKLKNFKPMPGIDNPGLTPPEYADWFVAPICRGRDSAPEHVKRFEAMRKSLGVGTNPDTKLLTFAHWALGTVTVVVVKADTKAYAKALIVGKTSELIKRVNINAENFKAGTSGKSRVVIKVRAGKVVEVMATTAELIASVDIIYDDAKPDTDDAMAEARWAELMCEGATTVWEG